MPDSPPLDAGMFDARRPRSLRRRLEQTEPPHTRVRSQAIGQPRRTRQPLPLDDDLEPIGGPWRAGPYVIGAAIVAWLLALAVLLIDPARLAQAGLPPRLLIPLVWGGAAAITLVPIQVRMALPGLAWQGMLGFGLLGYLLAFTPAPSGWLLDLPDTPVYLLFFFAVFYAITALALPLTYLLGQRFYTLRLHRLDVGRARRQAYEIALLIVAVLVMAGLRVLSPITFGLLAIVMALTEALLLSQVQPEG